MAGENEESVSRMVSIWLEKAGILSRAREPSCCRARPRLVCRFQALQEKEEFTESEDQHVHGMCVDDEKFTREAQFEFFEADVWKFVASAVRVAKAGMKISRRRSEWKCVRKMVFS